MLSESLCNIQNPPTLKVQLTEKKISGLGTSQSAKVILKPDLVKTISNYYSKKIIREYWLKQKKPKYINFCLKKIMQFTNKAGGV